jgi:hypothetical protein
LSTQGKLLLPKIVFFPKKKDWKDRNRMRMSGVGHFAILPAEFQAGMIIKHFSRKFNGQIN